MCVRVCVRMYVCMLVCIICMTSWAGAWTRGWAGGHTCNTCVHVPMCPKAEPSVHICIRAMGLWAYGHMAVWPYGHMAKWGPLCKSNNLDSFI